MPKYARIAITLPQEALRAADDLARKHDRSRSWIVAEAIRHYAAARGESSALGPSRLEQLRRDRSLTAEERVIESEEVAVVGPQPRRAAAPRVFASFDDFHAWRRHRAKP